MDHNLIDSVQYKKSIFVDRSILETISKSAEDFVHVLFDQVLLLMPHSFIAKQQSLFQTNVQSIITWAVSSDMWFFRKLLIFAAYRFHWNNAQATVHLFVAYYIESGKLQHINYIIISDCLHHDTVALHLFQ